MFIAQPQGYVNVLHPNHVCKLNKALYDALYTSLLQWIFHPSKADTLLFIYHSIHGTIFLLIYVDDLILTGSNPNLIDAIISRLQFMFALKDRGPLHYFLGIQAHHTPTRLILSLSKYVQDHLTWLHFQHVKLVATPMVSGKQL